MVSLRSGEGEEEGRLSLVLEEVEEEGEGVEGFLVGVGIGGALSESVLMWLKGSLIGCVLM